MGPNQRFEGMDSPEKLVDITKPGDKFQIAVFGINGPISFAPSNFVWFRDARVESALGPQVSGGKHRLGG